MPKRYQLDRPVLGQAVANELQVCKDIRCQQRLLAAQMAATGQFTAEQIARKVGISRRRFFDWMNALKTGGLEGLLQRGHGGGAAPRVRGLVLTELQMGLVQSRWKHAGDIQQWLRDRHAVRLKPAGVYYWLEKLGGVLKRSRKIRRKGKTV